MRIIRTSVFISAALIGFAPHSVYPQFSISRIADARKQNEAAVVTVAGRVSASKVFGDLTFVQDNTAGIPLFDRSTSEKLSVGDSVVVSGKIAFYRGMIELLPTAVQRIRSGDPPIARVISAQQIQAHEGSLVEIRHIHLRHRTFVFPQQALPGRSGDEIVSLWIDGDTNIPGASLPELSMAVRGVVISFDGSYQLMPRSMADIEGATVFDTTSKAPNRLRLLNWNVEFLGATREQYGAGFGPEDDALQLDNVALILRHSKADVIALQEVTSDAVFDDLLDRMRGYSGQCSDRYSRSFEASTAFPPQRLCYLYRNGIIRPKLLRPLFEKTYDLARRGQSDLLTTAPGGPSAFYAHGRLPYLMEFEASMLAPGRSIYMVNIHAKSGATSDDRLRREYDAMVLKDSLDAYFANKNLLIAGDFNDDLDESISSRRLSPYARFVEDQRYLCVSLTLSNAGWQSTVSYPDMIDHQIVSGQWLRDRYESIGILNPFQLVRQYGTTTSDHLPVVSDFRIEPEIVSGVKPLIAVEVYPNPTRGAVNVVLDGAYPATLTLSSPMGATLLSAHGVASELSQRCSDVLGNSSPGLYVVSICRAETCHTFRIVSTAGSN